MIEIKNIENDDDFNEMAQELLANSYKTIFRQLKENADFVDYLINQQLFNLGLSMDIFAQADELDKLVRYCGAIEYGVFKLDVDDKIINELDIEKELIFYLFTENCPLLNQTHEEFEYYKNGISVIRAKNYLVQLSTLLNLVNVDKLGNLIEKIAHDN